MELRNGHPCSVSNQNHIGKTPGANPLDRATHCSFASNIFMRKSYCTSGHYYAGPCIINTCTYTTCIRSACSICMVPMFTVCTSSTGHEEVPPHVLVVSGRLKREACISWVSHQTFSTCIVGISDKLFGGSEVPCSWHLHCGELTWRRPTSISL